MSSKTEVATLAGGCFWCLEAVYDQLKGVEDVVSGYEGGGVKNPTYEQVCTGMTGHAEVIQVKYNPEIITFQDLLDVFFTIHDPTTLNRQGADVGTQYRSAVYYHTPEQKEIAERAIAVLRLGRPRREACELHRDDQRSLVRRDRHRHERIAHLLGWARARPRHAARPPRPDASRRYLSNPP